MAQPMGMGLLGGLNTSGQKNGSVGFKRKFRWTFRIDPNSAVAAIPENYVKTANRPTLNIEETTLHYLNGVMYIPGKGNWENLEVTYYDLYNASGIENLYTWIASTYNFLDPVALTQTSIRGNDGQNSGGYSASGVLRAYDGCGDVVEQWNLGHMMIQSVNFGELDFSSSDEMTITLTLRYSECKFHPGPCTANFYASCDGCGSSGRINAQPVDANGAY